MLRNAYDNPDKPLPKPLATWPAISSDLERYFEAFIQISKRRLSTGGVVCPLQFNQMLDWCSLKGIDDPDEIEDYVYFVSALDDEFVLYAIEQARIEAQKARSRR